MHRHCLVLLLLVSALVYADDTVYLCRKGGKVLYSAFPKSGYDCAPVTLEVVRPSPAEVERHERDMVAREQQLLEIEEAEHEARLQQAEDEALWEARRMAEAEEAQALYLRDLLDIEQERLDAQYQNQYLWVSPFPRGIPAPPPPPPRYRPPHPRPMPIRPPPFRNR